MSNYWEQRELDALYNKQAQIAQGQLMKEYKRCANATKIDLLEAYNEILEATKSDTLLVSDLYKFNRYYELLNTLSANLKELGLAENLIIDNSLRSMYLATSKMVEDQMGFHTFVNEDAVKNAINSIWCGDGKHYSSRIWSNKGLLEERIKRGMVDCVARGKSVGELTKTLMNDFTVGYHQANRIARTELTYIQTRSTLDKFKEAGVKQVKFYAEMDEITSDACREHHGKIYNIDDVQIGVNAPPLHCYCRSCLLAVI